MEAAFTKTTAQVLKVFGVSVEKGLSQKQVEANAKKYGKNGRDIC